MERNLGGQKLLVSKTYVAVKYNFQNIRFEDSPNVAGGRLPTLKNLVTRQVH